MEHVVLIVLANIDFAEKVSLDQEGEGTIDGGAGDRVVEGASVIEQSVCGKVAFFAQNSFEDGESLACDAVALARQKSLKVLLNALFARAHLTSTGMPSITQRVNP